MTGIAKGTYWGVFMGTLCLGLGLFVFTLIYARDKAAEERDALCLVLYASINRSVQNIGKEGAPGYSYYKEHPDELAKARASNTALLDALPCSPRPEPPPITEDNKP